MIYAAALALGAAFYALHWYSAGQRLTPDGKMYALAAAGQPVTRHYASRRLLPWIVGKRGRVW